MPNWTKPLRMRDGRRVRVLCTDRNFIDPANQRVMTHVVLIDDPGHGELLAAADRDGFIFTDQAWQVINDE